MLQKSGYLKIVSGVAFLIFLSVFYFLGDITSTGYMEIIRRTENLGVFEKSSYFSYMNATVTTLKREGYLVWSPSCRIPDISPLHQSIRAFVRRVEGLSCGGGPIYTSLKRLGGGGHILQTQGHLPSTASCCAASISRPLLSALDKFKDSAVDDAVEVGPCVKFHKNITFTKDEQFVLVKCHWKKHKEIYANVHAMARKTAEVEEKLRTNVTVTDEKISIMFIGIDSISRLNLIRTMPRTVKYLNQSGWLELKGYNKIDDNTFPNLIAILTGHSAAHIRKSCWRKPSTVMDNCPFIWNEFSKEGYITAYGEDEPKMGTFNYLKAGFRKTPTDYYMRPYMLTAEKYMKKKVVHGLNLCLGPVLSSEMIFDFAVDFAKEFKDNLTFSLFWTNTFSHNDLNTPSAMDGRVLNFLERLERTGILNTTLVVFLSDHGMRFGKIRETYVGWLEERLPFIYFRVPERFRARFPERYNALEVNVDRLTSPYDLHCTLRDLGGFPGGADACPSCQSLFQEVPWNRSCHDVGVTGHWCTCSTYKVIPAESIGVRALVMFVLSELNKALLNGSQLLTNGTKCAHLTAHRVLSIRSKVYAHSMGQEEFIVLFETSPNEAILEATVRQTHTFELVDTVSRINTYGSQGKCISDSYLQKYCFCVNATDT